MFLVLSSFQKLKEYQMDVKSTFPNGDLEEEVYIEQLEGFILGNDAKLVCRLKKALYGCSLISNDESVAIHQPNYRSMIGSLPYLTGTRPDIMHAIGIVGRFQENPKESHLQTVRIIFKYLQGTQDFGLWYPADLTVHEYTDADWEGSVDDRKNTSGGAFYMGSRLVSWFNKKQSSITLSTTEA
eukprot:PITA_20637